MIRLIAGAESARRPVPYNAPAMLSCRPHWPVAAALLAAAAGFRLVYGLSMPFWTEDERQVYLIGLRSYARGEWPYFGADVVWTGTQVPGALLGWLIRLPIEIWPAPESPVVLLNMLSFAALTAFAWYLTQRFRAVPPWIVYGGLLTLPWTLNFSTHVVNPSYVLVGAVMFFLGFFETMPAFRRAIVPWGLAWTLMGAGLLVVMQMHLSWVLLPPFVLAAAIGARRTGPEGPGLNGQALAPAAAGFLAGAAAVGWLLAPTLLLPGDDTSATPLMAAVDVHWQDPMELVRTMARLLSFASFETNRFLGLSTDARLLFLWRHPLAVPFVATATLIGILHPVWMALSAFRRSPAAGPDWIRARWLLASSTVLVFGSYFFSVRGPQAHSFSVLLPVAVFYACACWDARAALPGARVRRWKRLAFAAIVSSVVMHAALAIDRWDRQSLYVDRALVAAAIADRNDRYLGDRRETAYGAGDRRPRPEDRIVDEAAFLTATPVDDLEVLDVAWRPVAGRLSAFDVTIRHRGANAAWVDIHYTTHYLDTAGLPLAARHGAIKQILQPGVSRTWHQIADGFVPAGAVAATFTVAGAERVVPRRIRTSPGSR